MTGQSLLFGPNTMDPAGEDGLGPLRKKCLDCTRCELSKHRTQVVFGEGNASGPTLCFVGEAPGRQEDETGRPFVGRAGQLLTKMIAAMGFAREEVYLCNVVNCRPPENRAPEKIEMDACHDYLLGQIRAIRPKMIVGLGGSAMRGLVGGKKKITEMRGKWFEFEGIPVLGTFHPSALARMEADAGYRDMKKVVWGDLQMVLAKLGRKTL